jgi:uncharacterized protein
LSASEMPFRVERSRPRREKKASHCDIMRFIMEGSLVSPERSGEMPRFLADTMLGRLATWLRILGYDTEYFRGTDAALIRRAREDGRILLTRDTGLLRRRRMPPHLFILSDHISEQLRQVMGAFHLTPALSSGHRCPRCNTAVEPRTKAEVAGRVPEFIWSHQEVFWGCPNCGRVYWAGSHRQRMNETIRALIA